MNSASLQKVRSGDPLRIGAAEWNECREAAADFRQRQLSTGFDAAQGFKQTGIISVRNDTDDDRDRFDALGIDGPLIDPADNEASFQNRVLVSGVTPTAEHAGRFVVLLEPIAAGRIGRACVDGVCVARVTIVNVSDSAADVVADETLLKSGAGGGAQLLWVQPEDDRDDDGVAWCFIRIGGGGGGAATASFAMITARAGTTPPYRYAAAQAVMDIHGAWTQAAGGTAYENIFNIEEQGAGGQWVNPLVIGDVVMLFAAPGSNAFVCTRSHYRGTY